uniref:SCP domain-containing protein n=1 Tax=Timema poppense TaxID=170557 RepID=A0A7R9HB00_TIMPO|nr:unnamed protein product [Timema poppensis]
MITMLHMSPVCVAVVSVLLIAAVTCKTDYCELCSVKKTHTMCKYPKPGPGKGCAPYSVHNYPMTFEEKKKLVDIHNELRNTVAQGSATEGDPGPQPSAKNMRLMVVLKLPKMDEEEVASQSSEIEDDNSATEIMEMSTPLKEEDLGVLNKSLTILSETRIGKVKKKDGEIKALKTYQKCWIQPAAPRLVNPGLKRHLGARIECQLRGDQGLNSVWSWDEELEIIATRWADQCQHFKTDKPHDECRDSERFAVGQNIAAVSQRDASPQDPVELAESWFIGEVSNFNNEWVHKYLGQVKPGEKISHYTQLVWGDSYLVGCGRVVFEEKDNVLVTRLVCNYGPGGNIIGMPLYKVGDPCSECPDNTTCKHPLYTGLCATTVSRQFISAALSDGCE